jgi:hypothetical protein
MRSPDRINGQTTTSTTFATNSVLLKYSAESQADLMGTQIVYDSKVDTRGHLRAASGRRSI